MRNAICGSPDIACNASSTPALNLTNVAAGTYAIVADTESATTTGSLRINLAGIIANDASCEGSLATSGALKCDVGFACKGTAGARTCKLAACNDTLDNDTDGKTDFPAEPGCETKSDDDETDTCPGAGCPQCADGADNDSDGTTDYPLDLTCCCWTSEFCKASEGIIVPATGVITGDTTGRVDDYRPSCASTSSDAGDLTYQLDLPALTSFNMAFTRIPTYSNT